MYRYSCTSYQTTICPYYNQGQILLLLLKYCMSERSALKTSLMSNNLDYSMLMLVGF